MTPLVRANTALMLPPVTVKAQHLEPVREAFFDDLLVRVWRSAPVHAFLISATIDVVEGQELVGVFTATCTESAVVVEGFPFASLTVLHIPGVSARFAGRTAMFKEFRQLAPDLAFATLALAIYF